MYVIRPHDPPPPQQPPPHAQRQQSNPTPPQRQPKGYGAFSASHIRAGDLVLEESPLLLYPQASNAHRFCSHCLKDLTGNPSTVACDSCQQPGDAQSTTAARFCDAACKEASACDPAGHSPACCAMMRAALVDGATDETVSALHLLSRVFGLLAGAQAGDAGSSQRYEAFMELSDGGGEALEDPEYAAWLDEVAARFAPCLDGGSFVGGDGGGFVGVNDFVKSVLLRDTVNAYGIRVPLSMSRLVESSNHLRGSALYREASRFNHECLPNVARCEDFERSPVMKFVALHDLPANEEITQSYFPLDWEVGERQARCRLVYGFECTCPRCVLEDASGSDRRHEIPEGMDEGYVSVFLLKYLCVDEACEGTMVPLAGEAMAGVMACNVCGERRTEEAFLEGLAAG